MTTSEFHKWRFNGKLQERVEDVMSAFEGANGWFFNGVWRMSKAASDVEIKTRKKVIKFGKKNG
jgi:hypothetical protein